MADGTLAIRLRSGWVLMGRRFTAWEIERMRHIVFYRRRSREWGQKRRWIQQRL